MPRSQVPHGVFTARLLEPFPKALLLMQMCQDYFEEEYTTEKIQSRPAFARKYRNIFADLPYLL